nr:hypothetical protein CFP56_62472 [Quercus suber]
MKTMKRNLQEILEVVGFLFHDQMRRKRSAAAVHVFSPCHGRWSHLPRTSKTARAGWRKEASGTFSDSIPSDTVFDLAENALSASYNHFRCHNADIARARGSSLSRHRYCSQLYGSDRYMSPGDVLYLAVGFVRGTLASSLSFSDPSHVLAKLKNDTFRQSSPTTSRGIVHGDSPSRFRSLPVQDPRPGHHSSARHLSFRAVCRYHASQHRGFPALSHILMAIAELRRPCPENMAGTIRCRGTGRNDVIHRYALVRESEEPGRTSGT